MKRNPPHTKLPLAPVPRRQVTSTGAPAQPSRYSKWRAATLAGVYVLMGLHVAHWRITGKTLAPLELNEVMYTLELGIVTAGFLFMLTACVATLLFGRFFCGWACHILALEDLCSWILKKLRIRPKPVRSRLLLYVPLLAALYMFAWPQASRVVMGRPLPTLRIQTDAQGWASFQTTDFWRNLPGPGIALLTFGICGFAIVYVLGSRSFCAFGCPYGAVFRGLDRLAPGRIVAERNCSNCGICTAVCPSHVVVHEELQRFGAVLNPACVKDLECVSACPDQIVKFGLTRPPLLRGWPAWRPVQRPFDFHWAEEALLALIVVAVLLVFRGLYDQVPFLMTLGLGAIVATLTVSLARMAYRRDVRVGPACLKRAGRLTRAGTTALGLGAGFLAFSAHSAFVRYHEFLGHRTAASALHHADSPHPALTTAALTHLDACWRWGLLRSPRLTATLANLYAARGELRANASDFGGARDDFEQARQLRPADAKLRYNLGVVLSCLGRDEEAIRNYREAVALDPADADTYANLAFLLANKGQWTYAKACLERALQLSPRHANAHYNYARVLDHEGRTDEANQHLSAAARADPRFKALLEAQQLPLAPW